MSYSPPTQDGLQTLGVIPALDAIGAVFTYGSPASTAWPLANLALYVPFSVSETVTAVEGWAVAGGTAGGNFDIGVYSSTGSRLTSAGATARTLSTVNNTTTMTNLVLVPGVRYYMAMSADGTNTWMAVATAAGLNESMGMLESSTSYVLPASPTISRTTRAYAPLFGLNLYTVAL